MARDTASNGQLDVRTCVLSVLVQNQPGVLAHISGMFASRGFNIDSLVVGRTEDPQLSRVVLVTTGDEPTLEQIRKQLGKIITTVKVRDITGIGKMTNLRTLRLSNCRELADISPLANLVGLRQLNLFACKKLSDLSPQSLTMG